HSRGRHRGARLARDGGDAHERVPAGEVPRRRGLDLVRTVPAGLYPARHIPRHLPSPCRERRGHVPPRLPRAHGRPACHGDRVRPLQPFALAAGFFAAALARDAADLWIDRTVLPPLTVATGVEVTARDGSLLRAFTVADGRWRLEPGAVDPGFLAMLVAYEDRRFYRHAGVDPLALLRAGWQAAANGRVVSGGSTLTMQVARLLEESGTGRLSGKLRQIRVAL